jgi:hypothetical protein
MTEPEWLARTDPKAMLDFLKGKASDRKLRLFAVACLTSSPELLPAAALEGCRRVERFADGNWPPHFVLAEQPWTEMALRPEQEIGKVAKKACLAAANLYWSDRNRDVCLNAFLGHSRGLKVKSATQAALLRDIFGNPFRPAPVAPGWRAPQVVTLAQAAYEQRELPAGSLAPARLAVLADALEEAGCTDPAILNHCRRPGAHVRGCWVVDLLLGKS